ncbi:LysR family transcriptional regulator [Shewanella eurypsychrophilus]|uniref:LysR family transcriptional regulator n=1 Tax=Shewanella eurypsychrophilus TaxID=2593656 RepID=A0ABX6V3H8_9GAMM|nr:MULTISPECIES: LysR family transcriptional regulator [Shewanella]QFU21240.1 LysR family transcriptional regulator [Shewanella sp. YLB-09]QPG56531.1 LysR family transcriptional regulator [Shewanella eurypsychrophilus]
MNSISFSNLDFLSINILVNLYEMRSVTKVSNKLNISAPKVSRCLKHTREVLGNELFIRKKHGLIPNEFTGKIYPLAKQILSCCSELQKISSGGETNNDLSHFEISAPDIISFPFPKILLSMINNDNCKLSFNISQWGRSSIDDVTSGKTDFGICSSDNYDVMISFDKNLISTPLAKLDSLYLICDHNHPLLKKEINLNSISKYPFIDCNIGSVIPNKNKFKEYCIQNNIDLNIEVEVSGAYSLFDCLRERNAITLLPFGSIYNVINSMPDLHACKLSKVETNNFYEKITPPTLYLVHNRNNKKPNLQWLADSIKNLFNSTLS